MVVQTWLACTVTGILPGYAGSFYRFTVPHLLILPVCAAAFLVLTLRVNAAMRMTSVLSVCGIVPTWLFAAVQWPGGDDGPGMAWWYGVGLASLVTTTLGLVSAYSARRPAAGN